MHGLGGFRLLRDVRLAVVVAANNQEYLRRWLDQLFPDVRGRLSIGPLAAVPLPSWPLGLSI